MFWSIQNVSGVLEAFQWCSKGFLKRFRGVVESLIGGGLQGFSRIVPSDLTRFCGHSIGFQGASGV